MKFKYLISLALGALLFSGCSCNQEEAAHEVEVFSESKPYSVEIRKERSYYQAEKMVARLAGIGIEAYIVKEYDEDGEWYRVMTGALEDDNTARAYVAKLDSAFHLPDLSIINYANLDSLERIPVARESVQQNEVARIDANEPAVSDPIKDVIKMFPSNNVFQLSKIGICLLSDNGMKVAQDMTLDLPRGLSLNVFKGAGAQAFASVIFKDNLYDATVTMQIVRLNDTKQSVAAQELCSACADKILATGKYTDAKKEAAKIEAYSTLTGYSVSFSDKSGPRKYYILTDKSGEYIYIAQSSKTADADVVEFIGEIGKSDGLKEYSEFYNTFYTVADKQVDNDIFLGYFTEKLTNAYARSKGNQLWAKKMVGNWNANFFFENKEKGLWDFGIFDLVAENRGRYIYNDLYLKGSDKDDLRTIYGVQGRVCYSWGIVLDEINIGIGRYVVAISPFDHSPLSNNPLSRKQLTRSQPVRSFSESDLVKRLEALQFVRGGYTAPEGGETASAEAES